MTRDDLLFLFGSGASLAAGMPSTSHITEAALSGAGVTYGEATYWLPAEPNEIVHDDVTPIVGFLAILKRLYDRYYEGGLWRPVSYEDLYFLASQIYDSELGEYDNPAIQPLINEISAEVDPLLLPLVNRPRFYKWKLHDLAGQAMYYIEDVVWQMISRRIVKIDEHLSFILDARNYAKRIDLFSLNHDLILEQVLDNLNLPFSDGFGNEESAIRYWAPNLLKAEDGRTRLFKLHGSIDWYLIQPRDGRQEYRFAQFRGLDPYHLPGQNGEEWLTYRGHGPKLLVGTFNKILQYTSDIYSSLHCHLHESLERSSTLIVSGYGFRDKGINTRIVQWISSDHTRTEKIRLIVIHHDFASLIRNARPVISRNWDRWVEEGVVFAVEKRVEHVNWKQDLLPLLD